MTHPQQATAATATASLICGLTGILLILPAPAAIILGIIALARIAGNPHLRGTPFAITGIATGLIGIAVPIAAIALAINTVNRAPEPAVPYPSYDILFGENAYGSGFHFEHNGNRYIAASLHQFDGETPGSMISIEHGQIPITRRVHTQIDVQILAYDSEPLDASAPLAYDPTVRVRRGDPVAIIDHENRITGRVVFPDPDPETGLLVFTLDDPDAVLNGLSGGPVVSGMTGTVIGVVIGTGPLGAAFEPLQLPSELDAGRP